MSRSLFIFGSLLMVCFSATAKINFTQHQLAVDFKITHEIAAVELLNHELLDNQQKQLLVIGEDNKQQRVFAIFSDDAEHSGYQLQSMVIIPNNFLAYDLLQTAKGQKLVFLSKDALFEYAPLKNQYIQFANAPSIYMQEESQYLAARDFAKDINGDELDDIIITNFTEINLFIQQADGAFKQQSIEVTPKMKTDEKSATFSEKNWYFADLNLDQKNDLILVKDAGLIIYPQLADGSFSGDSYTIQLPIDVKALDWWEIRESDGESIDQDKLAYRSLHQIEDINNDQLPDIIVRFSQSAGVLDRQNNYEVYLGKNVEGKIQFIHTPDSVLTAEGTTVNFKTIDLDQDKRMEVLLISLDIGVPQIIGALLSGSIDQDVYLFKMDEKGNYPKEPEVNKEVELNFSLSSGKSGSPVVRLGDFDGDGLQDLLFSDGEKYLRSYQGVANAKMFHSRSEKHKVKLPKDGPNVSVADLNGDGKSDIIIRYGRQDDPVMANQIVLLMAQ